MPYHNKADFHARVTSGKTVWSAGAYDALSARMIEAAGFDACMTSGFGVSASHLGMPDAELYTMTENLNVVRNGNWPPAEDPKTAMRSGSKRYFFACAFSQRTAALASYIASVLLVSAPPGFLAVGFRPSSR